MVGLDAASAKVRGGSRDQSFESRAVTRIVASTARRGNLDGAPGRSLPRRETLISSGGRPSFAYNPSLPPSTARL